MDENDPVFRLLAKAPLPEPDAWFAVRTLARCRSEKNAGIPFAYMERAWRWALGGGLGFCVAMILMVAQFHSEKAAQQKDVQDAFQFMASFDTDADSTTSWQDSSP
jgi:hypothetical protein